MDQNESTKEMNDREIQMIDNFTNKYRGEFAFYQEFAQFIETKIEDFIFQRGIKAIVIHRAKKPDSLRNKLIKKNAKRKYQTTADIYDSIFDLAGIRVSLYFPSDRKIVDELFSQLFDIIETKTFPKEKYTPKYEKRFSGYWATHYIIQLKQGNVPDKFLNRYAEVQVASVLMHAWSEVEHDLVYKPFLGNLSKEELAILDEINGLVLTGEIALERLYSAMAERIGFKKIAESE